MARKKDIRYISQPVLVLLVGVTTLIDGCVQVQPHRPTPVYSPTRPAPTYQKQPDFNDHFNSGSTHFEQGDYRQAITAWTNAINKNSPSAEAYRNRGLAYLRLKDYGGAIADCTKAISLRLDFTEAYADRASAYIAQDKYDRAIRDLDKAISLDPDYAYAYQKRGAVHADKKTYDSALRDAAKLISLNRDSPDGYRLRGHVFRRKEEYDLAILDFTKALTLKEDDAHAYIERAWAYYGKGDYDQAIWECDEALTIDSEGARALTARAYSHLLKGENDAALRDATRAIALAPENLDAQMARGFIHKNLREYGRALADCGQAIALDSDQHMPYFLRAYVYMHQREFDKALRDAVQAIHAKPRETNGYNTRGDVYYYQGNYEEAIPDYDKAISLDPDEYAGFFNRACAYRQLAKYRQAERDFESARLKAKNPRAKGSVYVKWAMCKYASGQPSATVGALFRKGLDANPRLAPVLAEFTQYLLDEGWPAKEFGPVFPNPHLGVSAASLVSLAAIIGLYGPESSVLDAEQAGALLRLALENEKDPGRRRGLLQALNRSRDDDTFVPQNGVSLVELSINWRAPGRTRVLAIGVGQYQDSGIPRVSNANHDADTFAAFARQAGIPAQNIATLIDAEASRSKILAAVNKLRLANTKGSETVIFYFSGHGAPLVDKGEIYSGVILPYDASEQSLEYTGIKLEVIEDMLGDLPGNGIIILDACFTGKEGRSVMAKNIKAIAVAPSSKIFSPETRSNTWWLTATSGDNFANDLPNEAHGLFTFYLLQALAGAEGVDANEDGLISITEAFSWTKEKVASVSAKSLGRLQIPELLGGGDTVLTIPR